MAYTSFHELLDDARASGSVASAVAALEAYESETDVAAVRARMADTWTVMRAAVDTGLSGEARSRSGLVGGDARRVALAPGVWGGALAPAIAAALATGEVNAAMGRVVAAPTGGASGVLPAMLATLVGHQGVSEDAVVDGLLVAAGIGSVIAAKATLSGAAGGCQAEIGSAAAMAAGAAVEILGGSPEAVGHAASFALQGLMGLVCDPVGGLVEVPCVARNATGVAVALAAVEMAVAGMTFPIPLDEVVEAMSMVGKSLPPSLRETALGGLAATPTGRRICDCTE